MDGNLQDIVETLTTNQIKLIVQKILKILLCLQEKNLIYIDLKLINILYKKLNNGLIDVCMGDLGGICKENTKYKDQMGPLTTYLPWEYRKNVEDLVCCESALVWFIGIIIMQILSTDKDKVDELNGLFHWSTVITVDKINEPVYLKDLNYMVTKYKTKCPILVDIFSLEPEKDQQLKK